jgi:hypothetical protein
MNLYRPDADSVVKRHSHRTLEAINISSKRATATGIQTSRRVFEISDNANEEAGACNGACFRQRDIDVC